MRALMHSVFKFIPAAALGLVLLSGTAHAQSDREVANRLAKIEQDLQRLQKQTPAKPGDPATAAAAQEGASDITLRLLAIERSVEQLTGQIEETKFTADRSAKQIQVLQDDLSLRLARIEQSLGLGNMPPAQTPAASTAPAPSSTSPIAGPPGGPQGQLVPSPSAPTTSDVAIVRSADDPLSQPMRLPRSTPVTPAPATPSAAPTQVPAAAASAEAVAPGGGFVIRTDANGKPLAADPNGPQTPPPAAPEPPPQQMAPKAAPGAGPVTSSQVALAPAGAAVSLPEGTPKAQYDFAFEFLKRQDYPHAETTLRDFLKRHPKDPLAGNAQYWLGETYYVRGDFQQAAVEFMAGYQNYPKTNKGPDNLLKLGMSMAKLNQTAGACTALGRLGKDYPNAEDAIEKQAKAERTRLKCK